MVMELALGTAQFGLAYGVASGHARVRDGDVAAIVDTALTRGVRLIDTAPAYGDSETIVGHVLGQASRKDEVRIVSKTRPRLRESANAGDQLERDLVHSLAALGCDRLNGLLVHDVGDILCDKTRPRLIDRLERVKAEGLVDRIGFSAYTRDEIDAIVGDWVPDIVQLPVNVLDQRLVASGTLNGLAEKGVDVHVRSAFLQGVVAMTPAALPRHLQPLAPALRRLHRAGPPIAVALGYLRARTPAGAVVVGAHSVDQIEEILNIWASAPPSCDYGALAADEDAPLDPRAWPEPVTN